MQIPLQVTFKDIPSSEAVERRVRELAAKLERFHDRVTGCHVVIERPQARHRQGRLYHVTIVLTVPGAELVINRARPWDHAHEDVFVALRDAFQAAGRKLEDHARVQRGNTKSHEPPMQGRVVKLFRDDGYGFLETPDDLEIYFHANSVVGADFNELQIGSPVRFAMVEGEGEQGPQASTVRPTSTRR